MHILTVYMITANIPKRDRVLIVNDIEFSQSKTSQNLVIQAFLDYIVKRLGKKI